MSPLTLMTVSVPEEMRHWVEQQVQSGGYASASEYVLSLIRRDQARAGKSTDMQAAVTEGLDSGQGEHTMDELREKALEDVGGAGPPRK